MNISSSEQRVPHVLAQGGVIRHRRDERDQVILVECFTRDGHLLSDCDMALFQRLKQRRLMVSRGGAPYRISRLERFAVRAQHDNR